MIDFQKLEPGKREEYEPFLWESGRRCEYSFVNLSIWGRQRVAMVGGFLTLFSQFDRRAVYPFPLGQGELVPVLDAIMQDACQRGIPCCISGLDQEKCQLLESLYPGKFRFYVDRNAFDYVYNIDDLADLKGRKYQKKRNHINKFRTNHPTWRVETLSGANLELVRDFTDQWFARRKQTDPTGDYHLEILALDRALRDPEALGLEGMVLLAEDRIVAFTMGSRMSQDCFDVHFEKAHEDADGAYPAINQAFAAYLRDKYPALRYLNREDDMGLEGLRKAKLSYYPAFLVEKHWARLWEDLDDC